MVWGSGFFIVWSYFTLGNVVEMLDAIIRSKNEIKTSFLNLYLWFYGTELPPYTPLHSTHPRHLSSYLLVTQQNIWSIETSRVKCDDSRNRDFQFSIFTFSDCLINLYEMFQINFFQRNIEESIHGKHFCRLIDLPE